jgi:hypothetical protein
MGWAIHGCGKVKTGGIPSIRFPRQDVGAFLECGQPSSFLRLKQLAKIEGLVSYKRAFNVERSVAHLLSEGCTLFLTRETRKGVMLLMRRSPYTPKQQ